MHFGKTGHFRKSGIPVPQAVFKEDLQRMVELLHFFKPEQLLVVGDFFHSDANTELDWFKKWRDDFASLNIVLVRGNHDILKKNWYEQCQIKLVEDSLRINSFVFTHDRCEDRDDDFTFCGHIHPGIVLNGLAKQSLRFPCFYFTKNHCILPAFSKFTGVVGLPTSSAKSIYAIVDNRLMQIV
mgnify:FL=1